MKWIFEKMYLLVFKGIISINRIFRNGFVRFFQLVKNFVYYFDGPIWTQITLRSRNQVVLYFLHLILRFGTINKNMARISTIKPMYI